MWPWIPLGSVAPMFYLSFCALFPIKTYHYGEDFLFYHKTKCKAADKYWSNVS